MWSTLSMTAPILKSAQIVLCHCTEQKWQCFQWPLILFTINWVHTIMLLIKICKRVLFTLAKSLACRPFRMWGVRCSVSLELFLSAWLPTTFSHACIQSIKYLAHMIGTHLVLYFHKESVYQKCRFRSVWLCPLFNLSIRQGRLPVLWDWTGHVHFVIFWKCWPCCCTFQVLLHWTHSNQVVFLSGQC